MQTVMAVVALAGSLASANIPARPNWQTDYFEARTVASGNKPLAVFLGSGANGWEKVVRDGLDVKTTLLLKDKYVCVFIDTDSPAGKSLAKAFAVNGRGLIISDRTGESQQFHHSGDIAGSNLRKALERYSDPERRFVSTETLVQLNPPPAPAYRYQNQYYTPSIRLSGG